MTSAIPRSPSSDALVDERLMKFGWYHGVASRDDSMKHLDGKSPGLYLVRKRKGTTGEYVLSVSEIQKVCHYIIQDVNGMYFKIGEQRFADIPSIIEFYKKHMLDTTNLIEPALRPGAALDPKLGSSTTNNTSSTSNDIVKVKAKFSFPGKDLEDLPFKKGDFLTIIRKEEDQWWLARDNTGREGMIPVPYVEVVNTTPTPTRSPSAKSQKGSFKKINNNNYAKPKEIAAAQPQIPENHNGPIYATALINREPNVYDEKLLGFKKGDIVEVLKTNDDGLWEGRHTATLKVGYFPFTHVKLNLE
ncbi:crk-like protein [Clytia hemisphaerica]|uniref:Adapter molecule Crk n=1 Tax=Clytia hemisphaerica TaxID=252671 RepID=A0A7M5XB28_9CNID